MATKKIFVLFTILLSMVGTKASAYDFAAKNDDGVIIYYNFIKVGTELEITSGEENYKGDLKIPQYVTYEGVERAVTVVGKKAFYGNPELISIYLPEGITEIGHSAFGSCDSLISIRIPSTLTRIETYILDSQKTIVNFIIDDIAAWCNVERSGKWMDNGHVIPEGWNLCDKDGNIISDLVITSPIVAGGFFKCKSLKTVTLDNIEATGSNAFRKCNLTSVTIGKNVKSLSGTAFTDNKLLASVYSLSENPFPIKDEDYEYDYNKVFSSDTYQYGTLYVPIGTKEIYATTEGWRQFRNIEEFDVSGISTTKTDERVCETYTINGNRATRSSRGVIIIKHNNGTTKKVLVK